MTTISAIGSGTMATAIGTRAVTHGHAVELMSRDAAKAQALADRIGAGATVGAFGARPAGHVGAVDVVTHYGDAVAGKTLVDITNPFNADATGITTTQGGSVSEQMAAAAAEGTQVVKAFDTIFSGVIAADQPMDVLFAGGDTEAKARFAAFIQSLDMRPVDTGGLDMAYVLEWAGILLRGVARSGGGFEVALGAASSERVRGAGSTQLVAAAVVAAGRSW